MKIEVGKNYQTRSGRKVEIIQRNDSQLIGGPMVGLVHFGGTAEIFNFYEDGKFLTDASESMVDIVGEDPAAAGAVAKQKE